MKIKNKLDFGLGIGTLLVSLWIIYMTMQLPAAEYQGDPGPKMFPMIGAVIMLICGIGLIIKQDAPGKVFLTKKQWLDAGKIFGIYLFTFFLMYVFGWPVAVFVILFILTFVLSSISMPDASIKKRVITSLIWAVIAGLAVYFIYKVGLKAKLPKGLMNKYYKKWF